MEGCELREQGRDIDEATSRGPARDAEAHEMGQSLDMKVLDVQIDRQRRERSDHGIESLARAEGVCGVEANADAVTEMAVTQLERRPGMAVC